MFVQMPEDKEELLKDTGQLRLLPNPFIDAKGKHNKVPYYVSYSNKQFDCYPGSIFSCLVTDADNCLIVEDLAVRNIGVSPLKEDSLHLFLGWFMKDAPKWADDVGMEYLLIQTKLPHCTEWFVEYKYNIRNIGDKGYSGLKTLKKNNEIKEDILY